MSHDFPDGPDYNPEPIDDDPWDVDTTSYPPEIEPTAHYCPICGRMTEPSLTIQELRSCYYAADHHTNAPLHFHVGPRKGRSEATEADLPRTDR